MNIYIYIHIYVYIYFFIYMYIYLSPSDPTEYRTRLQPIHTEPFRTAPVPYRTLHRIPCHNPSAEIPSATRFYNTNVRSQTSHRIPYIINICSYLNLYYIHVSLYTPHTVINLGQDLPDLPLGVDLDFLRTHPGGSFFGRSLVMPLGVDSGSPRARQGGAKFQGSR